VTDAEGVVGKGVVNRRNLLHFQEGKLHRSEPREEWAGGGLIFNRKKEWSLNEKTRNLGGGERGKGEDE